MERELDLREIHVRIQQMKAAAEELMRVGDRFPALVKNTQRILANLKMLEINFSDVIDIEARD